MTDCDDCTTCIGCGLRWCRANDVSPGEAERLCVDCFEMEDA
jgi:hypothetical protein